MLDDRRLAELLRMAAEVQEFEAGASGATRAVRPNRPTIRGPLLFRRWSVVAAAACAALAVVGVRVFWNAPAPLTPRQSASSDTTPVGGAEWKPAPIMVHSSEERTTSDALTPRFSVVLAIVEGEGELRCVRWSDFDWGAGRGLADIHGSELLSACIGMACERNPPRLLVVGLEGPRADLPATDEHALRLARCIVQSTGHSMCRDEATTFADAADLCLPDSVHIKVETLAMNR